ncbi:MAG: 4-hydroxy-3-methylbut-2-enyl diphosphate reductase [Planctomycetes bacterium]|nr:4-hydroxy-3-methylbut-2-enyl diphosphate reductase [Planctomycetota bacterium]
MKIILAAPRGFCAGVNMAIDSLDLALETFGPPLYVYHEIVHNRYVVETFRGRGVRFVDRIEDVPAGAVVLFSAHGVAPGIREAARARQLTAIDATCPLVTKVHLEAIRFAREGYTIVLIGHAGHDEVLGTMGEAPDAMVLVERPADIDRLEVPDASKVAYLTQTTLSVDDANRMINRLREKFPSAAGPPGDDICYATQNRQEAIHLLAPDADVVLILGSQNSSNSRRLMEIGVEHSRPSHLIDGVNDIDPAWFRDTDTVLISAGASAPESVVEECVEYLRNRFGATVEARTVRQEQVRFQLPRELRSTAKTGADRRSNRSERQSDDRFEPAP